MLAGNLDTIYFSDDWVLPKYLGWSSELKEENALVLVKRVLFVSKMLVLTFNLDTDSVNRLLESVPHNSYLTTIHWRDLTNTASTGSPLSSQNVDPAQIRVGLRWYKKASDSNKLIHWATFVVDLEKDIDEIVADMEATVRNKFRRAQKRGAVVTFEETTGEWTKDFYRLFKRLQAEFGLPIPDRDMLEQIFAGKNAVAVVGHDSEGISAINIIYLAQPYGYYMLGASSNSKEQGVGQLMQLETIGYLKSKGFKKYDLGGINSAQPGILAFKKSFGGDLYDLGSEWVYTPKLVQLLTKLRSSYNYLRSNAALPARFS
ncbi:GNAT family N-acetyltransferase [Methylocystis bryophila]|uniref:BioF2-like acetyltransferase domain-containing protein n=1 Tax=Methylocystis bryophila TaxID=655015 RepID=A0A1W6MQW0_9HYPH|nr:GNAT family N-acetyltransferase [Methylocystis bryophila]ARN79952.1 hypothetical protein B1812_01415 [Methylocystis bryophila]BDV39854.1 hypothetical protein DSM21852_31070 [Methylocystis bryophila]